MERLTIEYCGEYVPKEMCSIDRLGGADGCDLCCEYCKATEDGSEDCEGCTINQCFNKLGAYENLEERLQKIYGECDGLLEKVVEHLERHEDVALPAPVFKARLLTDAEVDRWEEFKRLEEQGKLLKLPISPETVMYSIEYCCGRNKDNKTGMCYKGFCSKCEEKSYYILETTEKSSCEICEIGKTVFFAREEAEAALKELGKG